MAEGLLVLRTDKDIAAAKAGPLWALLPEEDRDHIEECTDRVADLDPERLQDLLNGNRGAALVAVGAASMSEVIHYAPPGTFKAPMTLAKRLEDLVPEETFVSECERWLTVTHTVDDTCVEMFLFSPGWRGWVPEPLASELKSWVGEEGDAAVQG